MTVKKKDAKERRVNNFHNDHPRNSIYWSKSFFPIKSGEQEEDKIEHSGIQIHTCIE